MKKFAGFHSIHKMGLLKGNISIVFDSDTYLNVQPNLLEVAKVPLNPSDKRGKTREKIP